MTQDIFSLVQPTIKTSSEDMEKYKSESGPHQWGLRSVPQREWTTEGTNHQVGNSETTGGYLIIFGEKSLKLHFYLLGLVMTLEVNLGFVKKKVHNEKFCN